MKTLEDELNCLGELIDKNKASLYQIKRYKKLLGDFGTQIITEEIDKEIVDLIKSIS